jgi:putative sigma-54 modulation protein
MRKELDVMKISIRTRNVTLSPAERTRMVRRIDFALSQYRARVRQVAVVVQDENAQKGGVDKHCRLLVRVAPLGDIVAEASGEAFEVAAGTAVDRAARLISRGLGRLSGRRKGRVSRGGDTAEPRFDVAASSRLS